ncbi:MAG: hypothetical protein Q8P59_07680, partial [Dehalococcoidia bacterium]|nr:hypothetical protein [Dehalococcoidia bacterium]
MDEDRIQSIGRGEALPLSLRHMALVAKGEEVGGGWEIPRMLSEKGPSLVGRLNMAGVGVLCRRLMAV